MPIHLASDTRAALGGPGLPYCDSRSLWKDKFVLFEGAFDEAKQVALNLYSSLGRQDNEALRNGPRGWIATRNAQLQKQAEAQAQNRPFNAGQLNKATAALAATAAFEEAAPKPLSRPRMWLDSVPANRRHIFEMRTASRLLVGLANGVLENAGCTLHPLFGFAVIPGSALKAVARDAAAVLSIAEADMRRIFGGLPGDDANMAQGCIAFLDAHAIVKDGLDDIVLDVVTPHFRDYYAGKGMNPTARDEEAPMPSAFPAIAEGVAFEFALVAHTRRLSDAQAAKDLKTAADCLLHALRNFGVGAKTAAGYGRCENAHTEPQIHQDLFPPPPKIVLPVHQEVLAKWKKQGVRRMSFFALIPDLQRIEDNARLAEVFDAVMPSAELQNFRKANPFWSDFSLYGGQAILDRINRVLPQR